MMNYRPYHAAHVYKKSMKGQMYEKKWKNKETENKGSTYFSVEMIRPKDSEDERDKVMMKYGVIHINEPVIDRYIVEIDNHANGEPHFHIWRTHDGRSRMSHSRSAGINLKSNINTGLQYTNKERRKENNLNSRQQQEVLMLVEENRLLLLLLFKAFRMGKIKRVEFFDEEYVLSLFRKIELDAIKNKYKNILKGEGSSERQM